MDMTEWIRDHSWVLAPAFVIVLALFLWIKSRLFKTIEIKPVDVGIALIPFVLWMATAGIFKKVEVPGLLSFETADVIVSAAAEPINLQVSKIPVTALKADAKSGVGEIPRLIRKGTQVLSFKLGYSGYYGPAIWMYFNQLINSPDFKYVVINDTDDRLFGLFDARKLTALLNPKNNAELLEKYKLDPYRGTPRQSDVKGWDKFAKLVKQKNKSGISSIPGFVSSKDSVSSDNNKQKVLEKMESLGIEWLPVVKVKYNVPRFVGVVERSRLTTSLILDVTRQLESKKKKTEE